ncbi:HNH endonuclease signature motif containing protein [Rummeliibacillus pycnus]|uniref:HNH endonuclease signature motif containing protein n=1 Tax=Rummeliibacillus pycnus TaxID=101070 RepID=UPI0037C9EA79
MQNYINGIKSLSNSGKLQLENYASGTLNKYHLDDWLSDVGSTCPRADTEEVDKIEELKEKLLKASSVDEYLKIAEELGDANLDEDQKQFITMLKTAKGIKDGLYESGKDFVVGICNGIYDLFTTNPIETVESTLKALKAVADPETYKYLAKSIADSYERDVINGDAESRARWISYASVTVLTSVVGTKGAGAVTKAGMATTKAAAKAGVSTVKGALKETSIPNLFPYAPQHQLAGVNVGSVPFNTVDSVGLRDRLLSVAKVETKGSSKGAKGKVNVEKDDYFIGSLKGEKIHLKGVKVEEIIYTKRLPEETAKLRKQFNSSVRKNFLKEFANNPIRVEYLRKAGLGEDDIARMKDGLNPKGWQVHHNLPLDDGGTNDFTNLVLIKNDPYHKAVTNEQNSLTRGLAPKQSKTINWPMFDNDVYPSKPFNRREE